MVTRYAKKYSNQFFEFLKQYKIIGLATAFVMGATVKDVTNSIVNDLIMPFFNMFNVGKWEELILMIGPVEMKIGHFFATILNFLLVALVIFIFYKIVKKQEQVKKV